MMIKDAFGAFQVHKVYDEQAEQDILGLPSGYLT